jgi:hypothetical protein
MVIPLGCFIGWILSSSRERAMTAGLACFGLYFFSAFVAARLDAFVDTWEYFDTVLWVQAIAGFGLALYLAFSGRALPRVEKLVRQGDTAGLVTLLDRGEPAERLEAVRALGRLRGQVRRPLVDALEDADVPVRREAAQALIGVATAEDVPALVDVLGSGDAVVRRRALEALRWIEEPVAQQALVDFWRSLLGSREGRLQMWLRALPLVLGMAMVLGSLAFPWRQVDDWRRGVLWNLDGGTVVALSLVVSMLLPLGELLWGIGRRNLEGQMERLRVWAFLPVAVLALALLWPLQAPTVSEAPGWGAFGFGFWIATMGTVVGLVGAFFFQI